MGGRSGSSGIGGGSIGSKHVKEINSNGKIDISDNPLTYGPKDYMYNKDVRSTTEKFEEKHYKDKVEHIAAIDKKGKIIEEAIGDAGSSKISNKAIEKAVEITHNHPSGTGYLGGSFSEDDIARFGERRNLRTMRATTKEGTYSITKKVGFNATKFQNYNNSERKKYRTQLDKSLSDLKSQRDSGKISEAKYTTEKIKANNKYLVNMHNSYIAGQKKYGYAYTLERRK